MKMSGSFLQQRPRLLRVLLLVHQLEIDRIRRHRGQRHMSENGLAHIGEQDIRAGDPEDRLQVSLRNVAYLENSGLCNFHQKRVFCPRPVLAVTVTVSTVS